MRYLRALAVPSRPLSLSPLSLAGVKAASKMSDTNPFTYADLLAQMQALTPEQLAQPVKVWGEHPIYKAVRCEALAENYVADDGEAWPASDFSDTPEDEEIYVEKGTVVIWTE